MPFSQDVQDMASDLSGIPLSLLSLDDDRLRATLPPELANFFYRDELPKQQEERESQNLKEQEHRRAEALERTRKRWSWFSQAETLDKERHTSFGTLGYLPFEIRDKIYALVLNSQVRKIPKYWGCFSIVPAWRKQAMKYNDPMWWMHFENQACAFGCWDIKENNPQTHRRGHPGPLNLRTYFSQVGGVPWNFITPFLSISRSLRDEFSDYMLGSRDFRFNCPASFAEFLHKLRPRQIASLRRITIDFTGPVYAKGCQKKVPDPKAWATAFSELPSELSSLIKIRIMIGEDAPSFLDDSGNEVAWYQDDEDRIGETLLPLYSTDTVARILGIVGKALHKVAPTAKFFLPECEFLNAGDKDLDWYVDNKYFGDEGSPRYKIYLAFQESGMPPFQKLLVLPFCAEMLFPDPDKVAAD